MVTPDPSCADTRADISADRRPATAVHMRHNGMGDLVWHAEYFRLVAATSRDGQVTVVVPPSTRARELLGHEPWVREVVDYDRRPRRSEGRRGRHSGLTGPLRFGAELASRRLDRMVLFSDRPGRALVACLRAGIGTRIGYGHTWLQRRLLTEGPRIPLYQGPAVGLHHDATALAMAHGWCHGPVVPRLTVRPDAVHRMRGRLQGLPWPLHVLAIGASETYKQWGARRFTALATLLATRGHGVVLLGGPAERDLSLEILSGLPRPLRRQVMALTELPVPDSVAVLSLAQTCIGNDTGMSNIAAAVGTPTTIVLGPRPPLEHDPVHITLLRAPSLEDIRAEQVMQQVLTLRESPAAAPSAPGVHQAQPLRTLSLGRARPG